MFDDFSFSIDSPLLLESPLPFDFPDEDLLLPQSLLDVVREGRLDEVIDCLKLGTPTFETDGDGNTVLHLALKLDSSEVALKLIEWGAAAWEQNHRGEIPLHLAAKRGWLDTVDLILATGLNIEMTDVEGNSVLHYGVQGKDPAVVEALVRAGFWRPVINKQGNTPLHLALVAGSEAVAEILIRHGSGLTTKNANGETPVVVAAHQGLWSLVDLFLDQQVEFENILECHRVRRLALQGDKQHIADRLALFEALAVFAKQIVPGDDFDHPLRFEETQDGNTIHKVIYGAFKLGHKQLVEDLFASPLLVNRRDRKGNGLLQMAVQVDCAELVSAAVRAGAGVSSPNHEGVTAFHRAAWKGHDRLIDLLGRGGRGFDIPNHDGLRPIHFAAERGGLATVKVLVGLGANLGPCGAAKLTPLKIAQKMGNNDIVDYLRSLGGAQCEDPGAISSDPQVSHELVEAEDGMRSYPAVIPLIDEEPQGSPLHRAAWKGNATAHMILIDQQEDLLAAVDSLGNTPLHYAAYQGKANTVAALLRVKAPYLQENRSRQLPLHMASWSGSAVTVMHLLEADNHGLESEDVEGNRALHFAASKGNQSVVRILLNRNASRKAKNRSGLTPAAIAQQRGFKEIATMLASIEGRQTTLGPEMEQKQVRSPLLKPLMGQLPQGTPLHASAWSGHVTVDGIRANAGENLNAIDLLGNTPLHYAAYRRETDTAVKLLSFGASRFLKNTHNQTPLHMAAWSGSDLAVVKLLGDDDDELETQDADGNRALHFAACQGNKLVVRILLNRNASPEAKNGAGLTPVDFAHQGGFQEVVGILTSNTRKQVKIRNRITSRSVTESTLPSHDWSMPRSVAPLRHESFETGADSRLHAAAYTGNISLCKQLCSQGLRVDSLDGVGNTPLHYAAYSGDVNTVDFLVQPYRVLFNEQLRTMTPLRNVKNDGGCTPLHVAAERGYIEVAKKIVNHADLLLDRDNQGRTPSEVALHFHHDELAKFLMPSSIQKNSR